MCVCIVCSLHVCERVHNIVCVCSCVGQSCLTTAYEGVKFRQYTIFIAHPSHLPS